MAEQPDSALAKAAGSESQELADELLTASESQAVRQSLDAVNRRRLTGHLWFLAATAAGYLTAALANGASVRVALAGMMLVADLLLLRALKRGAFQISVRPLGAAVLAVHLVLVQGLHGAASGGGLSFWFVAMAVLAMRYRFNAGELASLYGVLYGLVALRLVVEELVQRRGPPLEGLLGFGILYAVAFGIAAIAGRRLAVRVQTRWRVESHRHRERLRMKQELEYARELQLSMLPHEAPESNWLDVAALSLPATEVGGDYYDYFAVDGGRLAIVIGDVTGHGVASGLVLSGVRAGLNLLADELVDPPRILKRINTMLKRTAGRRMHMTLGIAVFDERDASLTLATAGHPPGLVWRRHEGTVEEVGRGALPLGALERSAYRSDRVRLARGDMIVLTTDGVVETTGPDDEQFGWERLHRTVAEAAAGGESAKAARDHLLRALWEHKGDREQVDDVTMVIVRVR